MAARLEVTLFRYRPHCFCCVNQVVLKLTSLHLHKKSREVCIKARSPPASLTVRGQVTKHTTVKWPIESRKTKTKPTKPVSQSHTIVKPFLSGLYRKACRKVFKNHRKKTCPFLHNSTKETNVRLVALWLNNDVDSENDDDDDDEEEEEED